MFAAKFLKDFKLLPMSCICSSAYCHSLSSSRIYPTVQRQCMLWVHTHFMKCLQSRTTLKFVQIFSNKTYFCSVLSSRTSKIAYNSSVCLAGSNLSMNSKNIQNDMKKEEEKIKNILVILGSHGVTEDDIKEYLDLLHDPQSYVKVYLLTEITANVANILPLLILPEATLKLVARQAHADKKVILGFQDRFSYLCHHFELPVDNLVHLVKKHTSLLTMNFEKLNAKMQILKNANISSECLVKDPWIFNYNEKLLLDRVSVSKKIGLTLKPWLLRCSKKYFNEFVSKWKETQHVLAGDDQIGYLAKHLNCSKDYVQFLMKRSTTLHSVNVIKLSHVLKFLQERGYTPEEIRLFPKVFCSSIETLEKRFDEFYGETGRRPTLPQLCITKLFNKLQGKHKL